MITLHSFTLVVDGLDESSETALFDRCDDVMTETVPPRPDVLLRFIRAAPSLVDAIVSAVRDLDAIGLAAARIDGDDDLVTLQAIAARIGRSREAVRLWSVGRTGPGGFPPPVDAGRRSVAYYRWSQVAPWLRERMGMVVPDPEPLLAAVNLALQLRAMAPRVSRMDAIRSLLAA
jgi:hypothetical protein